MLLKNSILVKNVEGNITYRFARLLKAHHFQLPLNPVNVPNLQDGTSANDFLNNKNCVIVQIASVLVNGFDNKKKVNNVQLLFDSGGQWTHVSEGLRKKLNLPTLRKETVAINTFGNKETKIQSIDVVQLKFILKDKVIEIECLWTSFLCANVKQNLR